MDKNGDFWSLQFHRTLSETVEDVAQVRPLTTNGTLHTGCRLVSVVSMTLNDRITLL